MPLRPAEPQNLVFVVDDDEDVLIAFARVLRVAGFTVETFTSATDFLQRQAPAVPCCLVLDLKLPGIDGLHLQDAMKQAAIRVPIIFVSGQADVPSTVSAMRDGAFDFLEKPVEDSVLIDAVARALQQDAVWRLRQGEHAGTRDRLARLTAREREVCNLVVQGLLNKQIADVLSVSPQTVKIHRARVTHKLEVGSVAELVRLMEQLEN